MRQPAVSRASAARSILSSSNTPLQLRSAMVRHSRSNEIAVRSLWWWSRHNKDWSSLDEGLEERVQRYNKIMRYRYSKALRRRSMWDRDDGSRLSSWGWRLPGRWRSGAWTDLKDLSSAGPPLQADVHEQEKSRVKEPQSLEEWEKSFHKDFESFKKVVDKAIDRDPYGTLFGRHLRSPPSNNNSSWTSFAWIFEPAKVANDSAKKAESATPGEEKPASSRSQKNGNEDSSVRTTFSVPPREPEPIVQNQASADDAEYEYDPISMRKVPKVVPKSETPAAETKPFLASLFSEHGAVDIPVKTYKPHKVYGYGSKSGSNTKETKLPNPERQTTGYKKGFESSRLRELQRMKASILGNSIDTTAEFGGKYQPKEEIIESSEAVEKKREPPAEPTVMDDAPLFEGTTYQSRSQDIPELRQRKSSWLLKEGFQSAESTAKSEKNTDKINTSSTEMPISKKMETSLDRLQGSVAQPNEKKIERSFEATTEAKMAQERAEDIDLLRASDVRAASRSARRTKQETQLEKKDARDKLESDYDNRSQDQNDVFNVLTENVANTTSKLSKSLGNVWKHVRDYPQGVVAKTVQSMGLFNNNSQDHIGDGKSASRLTEKSAPKDESLRETPSIYKKDMPRQKHIPTFTPSQEVVAAEAESMARTTALKEANEETMKKEALKSLHATRLARELRRAYEEEHGTITVDHRQAPSTAAPIQAPKDDPILATKPHPLHTATVKPGVDRDLAIEHHVNTFEPKLAALVEGGRNLRKNLHEVSLHIKAIKSNRPQTYWNAESKAIGAGETAKLVQTVEEVKAEPVLNQEPPESGKEKAVSQTLDSEGEVSKSTKASIPALLPRPACVFLAYNPETDQVDISPMSARLVSSTTPPDAADILTKLDHPSKFMTHFERLQEEGYELVKGGTNSLFLKLVEEGSTPSSASEQKTAEQVNPNVQVTKTKADGEELLSTSPANTPSTETSAGKSSPTREAATVLDQIPKDINPTPGPAAPTAPPALSWNPTNRSLPSGRSRVRRQEEVFSGRSQPLTPRRPLLADQDYSRTTQHDGTEEASAIQQPGFFRRFFRGVRRVLLTATAMAGVAYAIGVAAEGVGAQPPPQQQKRITTADGSEMDIVIRRGRPGIFSTENSR